jgi:trk system potassium uptake protein TrkA
MRLVILGCGRSGSTLALMLASAGHEVTLIDRNPDTVRRRIGDRSDIKVVLGNGLDHDILLKARVSEAHAFFALTRGDNTNLMAAQIVQRRYNVPRAVAKVADPLRADAYRKMGLYVINASALIAGMSVDWLLGNDSRPAEEYNILTRELEV